MFFSQDMHVNEFERFDMKMKLQELLTYFKSENNELINENPDITSIEMDSREVKEGSLFVCIKGYTVDGHDYAEKAVKSGAAAIVAEHPLNITDVPVIIVKHSQRALARIADAFYEQPTHKLNLIGITGTNGKTSTTHMIEQVMRKAEKKTGLIGTMYMKVSHFRKRLNRCLIKM